VSDAADQILAAIERWQADEAGPLVVAIDGHGAAGKTTIAAEVAFTIEAMVLHTDDYFHEAEDNGDPRPMAHYYSWPALREDALEPAIGWLREEPASSSGAQLILVEGVSSAAPALADLISRTVFVETPVRLRLERLHRRISDEEWDEEWLYAERLYFASRPPDSFDLVVSGMDTA
jgi:uridine kinase